MINFWEIGQKNTPIQDAFGISRSNHQVKYNPSKAQIASRDKAREIGVKKLNERAKRLRDLNDKKILKTLAAKNRQVCSHEIASHLGLNNDWLRKTVLPRLEQQGMVERVIVYSPSG